MALHARYDLKIIEVEWLDGEIVKIAGEDVEEYIKRFCEGPDEDETPDRSVILEPYT